jgi:hypothetical protein
VNKAQDAIAVQEKVMAKECRFGKYRFIRTVDRLKVKYGADLIQRMYRQNIIGLTICKNCFIPR